MPTDSHKALVQSNFGPVYFFIVLIHFWILFLFISVFALLFFGIPGLRAAWQTEVLPGLSAFSGFLIALGALTLLLISDLRASYRSPESKAFSIFGASVNGLLLIGIWANVYSLRAGPLNDGEYALRLVDEFVGTDAAYIGRVQGVVATGCRTIIQPCVRVELENGDIVAATPLDRQSLGPSVLVIVDKRAGILSEEIWYEARYINPPDPETFWRSVIGRR